MISTYDAEDIPEELVPRLKQLTTAGSRVPPEDFGTWGWLDRRVPGTVFVFEWWDQPVAQLYAARIRPGEVLLGVFVDPAQRGLGIGTRLLHTCLRHTEPSMLFRYQAGGKSAMKLFAKIPVERRVEGLRD